MNGDWLDCDDCPASLTTRCPRCGVRIVEFVPAPPDDTDW